jgi:tetratricopeptide (TPR) repeat protein
MTAIGGFNLYLANNPQNPYPYYRPVPFASTVPSDQAVQFIIEASRRTGKKLSAPEASSYWSHEVIKTAITHPAAISWKMWQKVLVLFNQFEAEDNYHIGFTSKFVKFLKLPFFGFWIILPLGMAGIALNILNSKKSLALILVFAAYAVTLIVFFTNARIRIPLLIILIPFAVMGIYQLFSLKGPFKAKRVFYMTVALIFFIIEFLPVQGTGDMTAYYNSHAINLVLKGLEDEAISFWKASSDMNRPYSAYANLSLARTYYQKGFRQKGMEYINKVPDDSFAAAAKYELSGDIMRDQGQIESAITAYQKSLEINSGLINPRKKLIGIYQAQDPKKALQEEEQLKNILSFYEGNK